jgi:nitroreductase
MNRGDPLEPVRPLLRTHQVREFTSQPPTEAEMTALTEVARWSGSSRNAQPWRFIVIRDPETLHRLGGAGFPSSRALMTAPAAIAIVLPGDPDDIENAFDEGRATERILVAATSLRLGAGMLWLWPELRPMAGELLRLPGDRYVRTIVAIGHPSEAAKRPKSAPGTARLPASETVLKERWPQG